MKRVYLFSLLLLTACNEAERPQTAAITLPPVPDTVVSIPREDPSKYDWDPAADTIQWIQVDAAKQDIRFFWKDEVGIPIKTLSGLREQVEKGGRKLMFAMNGGIFMNGFIPLGLYMEEGKVVRPLNRRTRGHGNFYMQPGGVFYLTKDHQGGVSTVSGFSTENKVFATQSGPMLVINGKINPSFHKGSENINTRNGVGLLPSGELIMAITGQPLSFYDFARFFQEKGCVNALYLDGAISEIFYPAKNIQPFYEGGFGVMIGVLEP